MNSIPCFYLQSAYISLTEKQQTGTRYLAEGSTS